MTGSGFCYYSNQVVLWKIFGTYFELDRDNVIIVLIGS